MLLYTLSAIAVAIVVVAFTFWVIKQTDDDVPSKTNKKHHPHAH